MELARSPLIQGHKPVCKSIRDIIHKQLLTCNVKGEVARDPVAHSLALNTAGDAAVPWLPSSQTTPCFHGSRQCQGLRDGVLGESHSWSLPQAWMFAPGLSPAVTHPSHGTCTPPGLSLLTLTRECDKFPIDPFSCSVRFAKDD